MSPYRHIAHVLRLERIKLPEHIKQDQDNKQYLIEFHDTRSKHMERVTCMQIGYEEKDIRNLLHLLMQQKLGPHYYSFFIFMTFL